MHDHHDVEPMQDTVFEWQGSRTSCYGEACVGTWSHPRGLWDITCSGFEASHRTGASDQTCHTVHRSAALQITVASRKAAEHTNTLEAELYSALLQLAGTTVPAAVNGPATKRRRIDTACISCASAGDKSPAASTCAVDSSDPLQLQWSPDGQQQTRHQSLTTSEQPLLGHRQQPYQIVSATVEAERQQTRAQSPVLCEQHARDDCAHLQQYPSVPDGAAEGNAGCKEDQGPHDRQFSCQECPGLSACNRLRTAVPETPAAQYHSLFGRELLLCAAAKHAMLGQEYTSQHCDIAKVDWMPTCQHTQQGCRDEQHAGCGARTVLLDQQQITPPAASHIQHRHKHAQLQHRADLVGDFALSAAPAAGSGGIRSKPGAAGGGTGGAAATGGGGGGGASAGGGGRQDTSAAAGARGPGAGGISGAGDADNDPDDGDDEEDQSGAAGGGAAVQEAAEQLRVVSYFAPMKQRLRSPVSHLRMSIPKKLLEYCVPSLGSLSVGAVVPVDVTLLLVSGSKVHARLTKDSEGTVPMTASQKSNIWKKEYGQKKIDKYFLEDVTGVASNSAAPSELWAAGMSLSAAKSGTTQALTVMLTKQTPDRPSKKVIAVTADGEEIQADDLPAAAAAAAAKVSRQPGYDEGASAAMLARHHVTSFCRMMLRAVGYKTLPLNYFLVQRQQLSPGRTPIIPGSFAKKFMPDLWGLDAGDSLPLDVTFAVLPPGTAFATPDSREVTSYKLQLTVSQHAQDGTCRLYLHGRDLITCQAVKQQCCVAGISKLSDSAIKLYIIDTKSGISTGGQTSAAAAGSAELDVGDVGNDDIVDGGYGANASDLAAQYAAEAEAEQTAAAEQAAAPASAAAIDFEALELGDMFQVTQTIFSNTRTGHAPRLPNSFLFHKLRRVREQLMAADAGTGVHLAVQLVLLPPGVPDWSSDIQPEAVVNVCDCKAVRWQHKQAESHDNVTVIPLMKRLGAWKSAGGELYLVGIKALGEQGVQLLLSQQVDDERLYKSHLTHEQRLQRRRAIAAARAQEPEAEQQQQERRPIAGKVLGSGGGAGRSAQQLLRQRSLSDSALARQDSDVSTSSFRKRQRLMAPAGVIPHADPFHRGHVDLHGLEAQGSGSLQSGVLRRDPTPANVKASSVAVKNEAAPAGSGLPTFKVPEHQQLTSKASQAADPVASNATQQQQPRPGSQLGPFGALPVSSRSTGSGPQAPHAAGVGPPNGAVHTAAVGPQGQDQHHAASPLGEHAVIQYAEASTYQGIRIRLHERQARALGLFYLFEEPKTRQVMVQFVEGREVVAGPISVNIRSFSGTYIRLHQQDTLDQLVQCFHGYKITAISPPSRSSSSFSSAGNTVMGVLSLHIVPPENNSNHDGDPEKAASGDDVVQREQLVDMGSFSQPAHVAAAADAVQQQYLQEQQLAVPSASGAVVKQEAQLSLDDHHSSQQQQQLQQQVPQEQASIQASTSREPHKHQVMPQVPTAHAPEFHQELESRPLVAVKQELLQQYDSDMEPGGQLQSPFVTAAAAAAAGPAVPHMHEQLTGRVQQQQQQQEQRSLQDAAAAGQPAATGGVSMSAPLGSHSTSQQQQHSLLLEQQLDQLQLPPCDVLSDEVVNKLFELSNILVGLGQLSDDTAVTFQELLMDADESNPDWTRKLTKRCEAIRKALEPKQFQLAARHIERLVETWPGAKPA